jgi:hypothetical protein
MPDATPFLTPASRRRFDRVRAERDPRDLRATLNADVTVRRVDGPRDAANDLRLFA